MSSKTGFKDTFYFPEVEDITRVTVDRVKGVLGEPIRALIKRLASRSVFSIGHISSR